MSGDVSGIAERLAAAPAVGAVREALGERDGVWVVGGAVRDAALGRAVVDIDLAVAGSERDAARAIARAAGGHAFELSAEFGTWRAAAAGSAWHVDASRLRGDGIEADLAQRDFTVNTLALPLAALDGPPLDPHGGLADLEARRLRAVSERSFADDPLRILRAARLAAELGFEVEAGTAALARAAAARAGEPAGERQLAELRLLVGGPEPLRGLELMDALGASSGVLPELDALGGVEQTPYHHRDVHGHTIEVLEHLLELEADLPSFLGEHADRVADLLAEPLADELSRGGALRFAALFHDLAKPETRAVSEEGRVSFFGHDRAGVPIVRAICERLRASRRLADYLASLTLNHLRLGFLVHQRPLSRRDVYDYLLATDPWSVDVTMLTIADRLATQSERVKPEIIDAHLELAREMVGEGLAWHLEGPPRSPLPGDELARAAGIEPGPELGRVIAEIQAAVFAGEVSTPKDAIELARRLRRE